MNDIIDKYRTVFIRSQFGLEVLADIMTMAHFGETLNADNPHRVGEYNIGIAILAKTGIISKDTKMDVMRALSAITPKDAGKKPANA